MKIWAGGKWHSKKRFLTWALKQEIAHWQTIGQFLSNWSNGVESFTFQTSGSTGSPKSIVAQHRHLEVSARASIDYFGLNAGDVILCCLPSTGVGGLMLWLRAWLVEANVVAVLPQGNPLTQQLPETTLSFASMVPYQLGQVFKVRKLANHLKSCKVLLGGGPVDASLVLSCQESRLNVWHSYGMTETYSHVALRQLSPVTEPDFTTLTGARVGLIDGKLVIDFPALGITQLLTEDLASVKDDTHFSILGRANDFINSAGVKIDLARVEVEVTHLFAKQQWPWPIMALGLPSKIWGQALAIWVEQPMDEMQLQAIKDTLSQELHGPSKPKAIVHGLPFGLSPTGKVSHRASTAQLLDQSGNLLAQHIYFLAEI